MEISNEKFGMLLKEAASEAGRRRGISVAHTLIDEGVIGSTSALSWLYNGQSKDDEKYATVMLKIIDLLPSWRKEHYYSEIGKIVLGRQWKMGMRQVPEPSIPVKTYYSDEEIWHVITTETGQGRDPCPVAADHRWSFIVHRLAQIDTD